MVNFLFNLIFVIVLVLVIFWLIRNRKLITNYRLRQWQEEGTKIGAETGPDPTPFVNSISGLTVAQRLDLVTTIQTKLAGYKAPIQESQKV